MTRILSAIIDKSLRYTLQLQIWIGIKNIACYEIKKTKRGSYEVACHVNCLFKKSNVLSPECKYLYLFCDNCGRQRKKIFIFQMLSFQMKNIESVDSIFLEKDHKQNNKMILHIQHAAKKGANIYHPTQYVHNLDGRDM